MLAVIGYWRHTVIHPSVCLSIYLSVRMLCIVAKRYILQQVSEQVNRKCPLGMASASEEAGAATPDALSSALPTICLQQAPR